MKSTATDILHDFVSLFFPNYCVSCENALVKGEQWVCSKCMLELPKLNYHREPENPLFIKLRSRLPLQSAMAFLNFTKGNRVQDLLHALKYKNQPELGKMLGRVFGSSMLPTHQFDVIVPVPLHRVKHRRRGYNQSEVFGLGLSEALGIPCAGSALVREVMTESQTKKSRLKRWENVKEIFSVKNPEAIREKNVLLIDDVVTTGATLEACAQALLAHRCRSLSVACIAATV